MSSAGRTDWPASGSHPLPVGPREGSSIRSKFSGSILDSQKHGFAATPVGTLESAQNGSYGSSNDSIPVESPRKAAFKPFADVSVSSEPTKDSTEGRGRKTLHSGQSQSVSLPCPCTIVEAFSICDSCIVPELTACKRFRNLCLKAILGFS